MRKQFFATIFIFLFFGMLACQGDSNDITTQEGLTTSQLSTDNETQTEVDSTTNQQTTQEQTTTELVSTSEDTTTTQSPTTTETLTTTEVETTTEAVTTTEAPTTTELPTTTEATTIHYVTIYFENPLGGTTVISMTGIAGNPFEMPDDPIKNFYDFQGWFLEEDFITPFDITEYPDEDMTVYAKWQRLTEISFDSLTVLLYGLPGDTITMPNDPSKSGFIFDGWYTDQTYTTPFIQTVFPESDITLYAKWVEEVTNIDIMIQVLENDYGFTCTNNICVLEEYSWRVYTFNLNTLEFKYEENITDDNDPNYYKNELLVINELWNVEYTISESTGNTSMKLTGNALTGNYSFSRFSSSIYEEDDYYDDMVNIIQGGQYTSGIVGWIESMLDTAGLTFNDLSN
jgi:uncharacterized repeat protein (TIGR02543 family)